MNVLIAEAMSATNCGEAAIFWGIREAIGDEHRYALCTATPEEDRREYGPEVRLIADNVVTARTLPGRIAQAAVLLGRFAAGAVQARTFPPARTRLPFWNALQEADVVLIGHDNVLVGRMLFNLCGVILAARALGKPVIIYAATVGPFSDVLTRVLTAWVLRRATLVTLREPYSLETTRRLLGTACVPVHVATDPAFLMPPASPERVDEILRTENIPADAPLIAVTTTIDMARRFAAAHGLVPGPGAETYLRDRAALLDSLVEQHGAWVLLLPHNVGGGPSRDDRFANAALLRHIHRNDRVRNLPANWSARDLKGLISRCRLLIGDRTHSLIAAASLGVPIVGISSRITRTKTRGILGDTMGLNDAILDVETLDNDALARTAAESWDRHDAIRARLIERRSAVLDLARRQGQLVREQLAPATDTGAR